MPAPKTEPKASTGKPALYGRVREILAAARTGIARTVNTTQVMANWLIGREIVEEEQRGRRRAGYGTALLVELAERLRVDFGAGYGVDNLELFRRFYLEYPQLRAEAAPETISDAPRRKSATAAKSLVAPIALLVPSTVSAAAWQPGRLNPGLSWTHYRTLLKVDRRAVRDFYEIESTRNGWSARQLERQINSFLFERLAKSRDKKGVLALANEGQALTRPQDAIKDPYVLEFLDLPESHRLVESRIEEALIDQLQAFLLELGSGFAFVGRQRRLTLDGDHFYPDPGTPIGDVDK